MAVTDALVSRVLGVVERVVEEPAAVAGAVDGHTPDEIPLSALGINSLLLFLFIRELEAEFQFEMKDEDLVPDRFETLGSVCGLLQEYPPSA